MDVSIILWRLNELAGLHQEHGISKRRLSQFEENAALQLWNHLQEMLKQGEANAQVAAIEHDYMSVSRTTRTEVNDDSSSAEPCSTELCIETVADPDNAVISEGSSDDCDFEPGGEARIIEGQKWTLAEMEKVVEYERSLEVRHANSKKKLNVLRAIQHRFKRVKNRTTLWRIRKYVAQKGTVYQKQDAVRKAVLQQFTDARHNLLPVHDKDLQGWARDSSCTQGVPHKGSHGWIASFKKRNRITSHKVNMVCMKKRVQNADTISQAATEFRERFLNETKRFPSHQIFNSDQSPYTYEYHSNRTLTHVGEKITMLTVQSLNKGTHSYTIQPLIDCSGRIRGKLYLCLQETNGRMGPLVEQTYFRAWNVEVTRSTSGKLTSSLFKRWVELVLFLEVTNHCLILLDAWTGQQGDGCFSIFPADRTCTRLKIPEKTTGTTQPLDVYFFRQWKYVVRYLYDYVRLHAIDINLTQRDNIIKMHSLIHNQFSADAFVPMIQYAWYKSGLRQGPPPSFKNAHEILIRHVTGKCSDPSCEESAFIRCSHCESKLCFKHFFESYHTHWS